MTISFNEIPNNLLTPFFATEFDNTKAQQGPAVLGWKTLLIGNILDTGTVAEKVLKRISSHSQAAKFFGKGSLLHDMAKSWFENNLSTEVWAIGLDDAGSAVQASGSFAMSGEATESGSIAFYIGGERIEVGVAAGDDASDIATALRDELNLAKNENLPVNFGGSSGTVQLEVKNGGAFGNDLPLKVNHLDGEEMPDGVSVSITPFASGAVNPDVADAIAAMGEGRFNLIMMPYTDTNNLDAMQEELELRWGPTTQNDGQLLVCKSGDDSALNSLGQARNNAHECILGYYGSPTSPWKLAAMAGGRIALAASIDPARPFQTLKLTGARAAAVTDRFTRTERNNILSDGIATLKESADGGLTIDRLVTTYKTNSFGSADTSYRDANTLFTLSFLRYDWNAHLSNRYPRHKLADDGTRFSSGQAIVTPSVIKAEAINKFREWEFNGLVEGFEQFKNGLIVERDVSDPNRLNVLLPPDVVNQLIIAATQIQFIL